MDPITQKVLERFCYEKLLMASGITPKRVRITLEDIFHATPYEPRIAQALPGLLLYKPSVVYKLKRDLPHHQKLVQLLAVLFDEKKRPKDFLGIPVADCVKAALIYKNFLKAKTQKQKSRTITLRLSPDDYNKLTLLSKKTGGGYSALIRKFIEMYPNATPESL
ncbi:hypothetical protein K1X76_09140 [bacterium]|nr:hypothetical protein [bacterium]